MTFKLNLVIFGAIMLSIGLCEKVHAGAICDTLEDCLVLQTQVAARVRELAPQPQVRISIAGYKFTHVTDRPELGDAWRDESGLIWGDRVVVLLEDGRKKEKFSQYEAAAYCSSIGAFLPTKKQYEKLVKYLGGDEHGYNSEILPNLIWDYWTATTKGTPAGGYAWGFHAYRGTFEDGPRSNIAFIRCVSK